MSENIVCTPKDAYLAELLLRVIDEVERPMLMYDGEKEVVRKGLMLLLDRQPMDRSEQLKHGKWILKKELVPLPWDWDPLDWDNYDESTHSEWEEFYHCSICDYQSGHFKGTNYCPNCGAKMDKDESDET